MTEFDTPSFDAVLEIEGHCSKFSRQISCVVQELPAVFDRNPASPAPTPDYAQGVDLPKMCDDGYPASSEGGSRNMPGDLESALHSALSIHDPCTGPNGLSESSPPLINAGFSDLPVELFIGIVSLLRPVFPRKPRHRHADNEITRFYQERRAFAALRAVCVGWCRVLTPMVYEEVVLDVQPLTPKGIEAVAGVLNCAARHVKSVVLRARPRSGCSGHDLLKQAGDAIRHGLRECSQLRHLELHGDNRVFAHRKTIHTTIKKLALNVTSLSLNFTHHKDLSHLLVGLGRSLERLQISNSMYYTHAKFHLPSELPRLQHLELSGRMPPVGNETWHVLNKLFSRIKNKKTGEIPLQSLVLDDVGSPIAITTILSADRLGSRLVTLRIRLGGKPSRQDTSLPTQVLKLCPTLIDFTYIARVSRDVFEHIPPTLRHLSLEVDWKMPLITPEDLQTVIGSRRSSALETLTILNHKVRTSTRLPYIDVFSKTLVNICRDLGVRVEEKPYGAALIMHF
ncbi:hypothetical protein LshimejAT787_0904210 [Lyophyllum shimeji]|uniref:Uncharacterized protein n=1 Tax=Lyophyllum shimeji TaxID=47721 RepID=A0A9P3PTY7_LYOSH|nr:hypothetical protein LshimejAT787_0904210 [Lyophyllum shimeji]